MLIHKLVAGSLLLLSPLSLTPTGQEVAACEQEVEAKAETVPVLPDAGAILEVELQPSVNAKHGGELNAEKFKQLIGTAQLLSDSEAQDKKKTWHFAPWYDGSFTTKQGTYRFSLYLGGLGSISTPDKKQGMFTFEHKK